MCLGPFSILAPAKILEPAQNEPKVVLSLSHALNRTCRARGNPQPKVQWWRGSELIKEGTGRHGVRLVIESASESDFGNYSCVAENWHTDQRFFLVEQGMLAICMSVTLTQTVLRIVSECLQILWKVPVFPVFSKFDGVDKSDYCVEEGLDFPGFWIPWKTVFVVREKSFNFDLTAEYLEYVQL